MRFETLKRIVLAKPNGTYSHIIWEKALPVRKTFPGITVVKRTSGTVRTGINYNNLQSVRLKRENGILPEQPQSLPWGEWLTYPHFIQHKGNKYLRVSLDSRNRLESEYFINGVRATKEQAMMYCTKAAFPTNENNPDVLAINVDNIISIR